MADIIFNTQTVTGFVSDDTFQAYTPGNISPPQFVLEDGVEYTVIWETDTFKCTAFSFTFSGMTIIAIGNGATFGYSGNDEPFCMTYNTYADVSQIFAAQEGDSHTVGIYKAAAPAASAIVLKDRDGNDVPYEGVNSIRVCTLDGGTQSFINGELEKKTVYLDFREGDMTLVPEDGKLWSEINIPQPYNFVPANIAFGETIAGITGTFAGSGVNTGDIVVKSGSYTATATGTDNITVEHGLECLPDMIFIYSFGSLESGCFLSLFAMCHEIVRDTSASAQTVQLYSGGSVFTATAVYSLYDDSTDNGTITAATPTVFKVGGSVVKHVANGTYRWIAVGGLIEHEGYLYITVELDGVGNLLVRGGAPEIEQFNVYVDGVLAKTVDYEHAEEFAIDLMDVATITEEHTVTVEAVADDLSSLYPMLYYGDPATGYVAPITGTCGDAVTWALYCGTGELVISGEGAMADYSAASEQPWYSYASMIKTVTIEEGVTTIGNQSLRGLTKLTSVSIPEGVTILGTSAFLGCSALATIDLPDSLVTINYYVFNECTSLTSIVIPNNVTSMTYCFYKCTALKSVVIGSGLKTIGHYTFHTCTALTDVTIGENVETINYRAFQGCSYLQSITIPASVTTIGDNAFYGAANLSSAKFEDPYNWKRYSSSTATSGTSINSLSSAYNAATYLRSTYANYWWRKS